MESLYYIKLKLASDKQNAEMTKLFQKIWDEGNDPLNMFDGGACFEILCKKCNNTWLGIEGPGHKIYSINVSCHRKHLKIVRMIQNYNGTNN